MIRGTVWIVEDSQSDSEALLRLIGKAHDVRAFTDGTSLLDYLTTHAPPDALVLDWTLPDLSAPEIVRFLRAQESTAQLGVLILTGIHLDSAGVIEGFGAGANDYVLKPFVSAELGARVGALVRASQLRQRAERAESALGILLSHLPDALLALNSDGRIAFANYEAERILSAVGGSLVGQPLAAVLPAVESLLDPLKPGDEVLPNVQIGDGWYSPARRRLDVGAGDARLTILLRDVTAEVTAIRDRDEFLAMLSHELRNPLAPLRSAASLLIRDAGDAERVAQTSAVIERQVSHLARLLDDLLDVSRVTRGRIELRRELVDLRALLPRVLEPFFESAKTGGQRLLLTLGDGPFELSGDPLRLEQIIANLVENALRFTARGGHVTVSVTRDSDAIVLRVQDDGMGISSANLGRIFAVFAQNERTLARSQGGLGIGLPLVRALVELHGGSVTAESAGHGRGAEFTVRLPAEALTAPSPVIATPPHPSPARARRILVVDDNEDAAELLVEYLRMQGHDVALARSGEEALEVAPNYQPDLVFLDIGLPEIDGYEVARRLRVMPKGSTCMLVALTGYGGKKHKEQAMAAGFDLHLVKPFELAAVRAVLEQER